MVALNVRSPGEALLFICVRPLRPHLLRVSLVLGEESVSQLQSNNLIKFVSVSDGK